MTDAGEYRQTITFQVYNGETDSSGDILLNDDSNWTDFKTRKAAVLPVSGREFYEAEQHQSQVTHKIRCRWFSGAKAEMRILLGSRKFEIVSIIDWQERHESLQIMAKELVE